MENPSPPGGLPWSAAIWLLSGMGSGIAALAIYVRVLVSRGATAATRFAEQRDAARREAAADLEAAERRADGLEASFREHLEHDARIFRGEGEKRAKPHHNTGNQMLDAKRLKTETITGNLPADVVARVRGMIDRGEIPV